MNSNAAQEAEQFWNQRFDVDEFIFGKDPNLFLVESTKKYVTSGSRVLCVADGEGRNSVWLAQQGMQVDAFDVSAVAIKKAKKFASDNQVDIAFHHSDCDSYPWQPNQYDAIAAIFVQFADPALRARLFDNMINGLKPGGLLIVQGYTPKQLEYKTGGPGQLSHLYTEYLMNELLVELEILEMRSYETELQEGARHSGVSALIGIIARKR